MININEIRRGNILNCGIDEDDEGNEIPMPGRVLQIFDQTIHWTNVLDQENACDGYSATDADFIEPILLTPEWLERMGFPSDKSTMDLGGQYSLYFERRGNKLFIEAENTDVREVLYVHDAQNIYLALTGEELQIKII
jgi:cell wall assembly regulator SMI1